MDTNIQPTISRFRKSFKPAPEIEYVRNVYATVGTRGYCTRSTGISAEIVVEFDPSRNVKINECVKLLKECIHKTYSVETLMQIYGDHHWKFDDLKDITSKILKETLTFASSNMNFIIKLIQLGRTYLPKLPKDYHFNIMKQAPKIKKFEKTEKFTFDKVMDALKLNYNNYIIFEYLSDNISVGSRNSLIDVFIRAAVSYQRTQILDWSVSYGTLTKVTYFHDEQILDLMDVSNSFFNEAEIDFDRYDAVTKRWIAERFEAFKEKNNDESDVINDRIYNMIRYYIRNSNESDEFYDDIQNLLDQWEEVIPLLSQQNNNLLQLAIRNNCDSIVTLLLSFPNVRNVWNTLGLEEVVNDIESSMRKLNLSESKLFDYLFAKYGRCQGEESLKDIRDYLDALYKNKPATVKIKKKTYVLPLTWEEMIKMMSENDWIRSTDNVTMVFIAYYQHTIHTARRFLLDPNSWYYRTDPLEAGKNCSSYKKFIDVIVVLYRVASDPTLEYDTIENRLSMLFFELAHINRAHNWDNVRLNAKTKEGEEYDDYKEIAQVVILVL